MTEPPPDDDATIEAVDTSSLGDALDLSTAIEFLEKHRPGRPWVLTAIIPDGGTETITATSATAAAFIRKHNGKRNIYYSVNPTRTAMTSKAAKTDIAAIEYLPSDLDPNEGENPEAAKARYLAALDQLHPEPTAIIDSGNGIQVLLKLAEPIILAEPVIKTNANGEPVKDDNGKPVKVFPEETAKQIADIENRAKALMETLGSVAGTQNIDRILRLPGTINLPNAKKLREGRVACPTKLIRFTDATCRLEDFPVPVVAEAAATTAAAATTTPEPLDWTKVATHAGWLRTVADLPSDFPAKGRMIVAHAGTLAELNADLQRAGLMEKKYGSWSDVTLALAAIFKIDRRFTREQVAAALLCNLECNKHITKHRGEDKRRRAVERALAHSRAPVTHRVADDDIGRLNKIHAVLPIGGKTRVVTFGELEEFPGRETIVMTQTVEDFKSLNNKYRHTYRDEDGVLRSIPMGDYWIGSRDRRQYDGGMAFMPHHDGDVGNKLNLWRGFGVKAIKGECRKFLDFMRDIICSGDEANFDYLRKREAYILQKRTRSEICLGLQTEEEGVGKGVYEKTMRRLLGNHAMMINKPDHLIGKHNPHLETLLRLTADETLFVHNPEHRNTLFNLITEPTLTIEPKFCGIYEALNYLNISDLSNSAHYVSVSKTARRFFIPTVSTARMQDFTYFEELQAELDNGGYEALLYHLLHEVDLTGFNVRAVPQTEGLRRQRNLSLPSLEAWWCELLETGTLWGADPLKPHMAVSNSYQRVIRVGVTNSYGATVQQIRQVHQPGLYDQARQLEPRLKKNWASDTILGGHLKAMGCKNEKVLRRRGWSFPKLSEARAKWVQSYPQWEWRDSDLMDWQAEGAVDVVDAGTGQVVGTAVDGDDIPF